MFGSGFASDEFVSKRFRLTGSFRQDVMGVIPPGPGAPWATSALEVRFLSKLSTSDLLLGGGAKCVLCVWGEAFALIPSLRDFNEPRLMRLVLVEVQTNIFQT